MGTGSPGHWGRVGVARGCGKGARQGGKGVTNVTTKAQGGSPTAWGKGGKGPGKVTVSKGAGGAGKGKAGQQYQWGTAHNNTQDNKGHQHTSQ